MKKLSALLMAGSLLIAGALTSPASAYDNYWNYNGFNNNRPTWQRVVNRVSDRFLGQPLFSGNGWNNNYGGYYNNGGFYNNYGYCDNQPGLIGRVLNRIF